jgi:ubiquinone/menaquinone biosynthesis C-methylase UbiE
MMPIDFHAQQNRLTYTTRAADESWRALIQAHVDLTGKEVADIGCGGGIYTMALVSLGAARVTGVDFSAEMLRGAAQNCRGLANVTFAQGDAYATGLAGEQFDLILERALIHHLRDLDHCCQEAYRLLRHNGIFIVQDRTPSDCLLPGNEHHIRGYFFEKCPRLIDKEVARRYDSNQVRTALETSGFTVTQELQLWETRQLYSTVDTLGQELLQRTGRSILHELNDDELTELVAYIQAKLQASPLPIMEQDAWTLWLAWKQ